MDMARIHEASTAILKRLDGRKPLCGMILGSGLSGIARDLDNAKSIAYEDIPLLRGSLTEGHGGTITLGACAGVETLAFCGRRHFYEGLGWEPVSLPVYAMLKMGVRVLLLTNAAGAINPSYARGDVMILKDHMNFMGSTPLIGQHEATFGPRFPDLSRTYDSSLSKLLQNSVDAAGLRSHEGVYMGVSGPAYETPSEIRAFRAMGADAVGMSTVPEAILAHSAGIRVAALSLITNMAAGMVPDTALSHRDVMQSAIDGMDALRAAVAGFLAGLPKHGGTARGR